MRDEEANLARRAHGQMGQKEWFREWADWQLSGRGQRPTPHPVTVIELGARETECIACGEFLRGPKQGIPLYEGIVVRPESKEEWGGFDACPACFALYEDGDYDALQAIIDEENDHGML